MRSEVEADFPEALEFLFHPARYKIAWGGRGAAKSWNFARALLIMGAGAPKRIVCTRETMKSIEGSVYKLLCDQITNLKLGAHYDVKKNTIVGTRKQTEFTFAGLKHNIDNIKSLEGADIVWVEEANNVSKDSWDKLTPTVRKTGSEIWVSFNPELDTDETYRRMVLNPPSGAVVRKVSWRDNPWFPEVLKAEMADLQAKDPAAYEHVYEGNTRSAVEGAVYSEELKKCADEGRICVVPYDRTKPVITIWDLGFGDDTAIWFVQPYGGFYNFIDFMEGRGKTVADYLIALQQKGYLYGEDWVPHDAVDTIIHKRLAGDRSMSIEQLMRQAGRKVRMVPKMLVTQGINAARTIFPQCRFDEKKCADGLQALRHYQWGPVNDQGVTKREPIHNWASHAADAFRGAALVVKQSKVEEKEEQPGGYHRGGALGFVR